MKIIISNSSNTPLYEQITLQFKDMIMNGELKSGDALPSMRALAKELRISLITTKRAYEELERDGYISSFTGRGSFVSAQNTEIIREERLKSIEEALATAVSIAKSTGIPKKEIDQIISILFEE